MTMLHGSCACGKVHYEIRGNLIGPVTYCHCWRCRKQSGSSFGTTAGLDPAALTFVRGQHLLRSWQSSPGVERFFASCCGSPIYKTDDSNHDEIGFRLGTLDSDPGLVAEIHFSTGSKAPWFAIADQLPLDDSGPPFGARD